MTTAAVQVTDLHVWYAQAHVLNGVNLHAMPGEIIVLLGRNGSGRRTALRAILGDAHLRAGSIQVVGRETIHDASQAITQLGLRFLPAESAIYPEFTTEENLLLSASEGESLGGGLPLRQIYDLCPLLEPERETLAERLDPGRQRMLAIARALRSGTSVLLMDDIALDLSPTMQEAMAGLLCQLKEEGYAIIMAERTPDFSARLADRFYVLERGRIVDTFSRQDLPGRSARLHHWLSEELS